jgi:hypothetical protein
MRKGNGSMTGGVEAETFTVRGVECVPVDGVAARVVAPGLVWKPLAVFNEPIFDVPPQTLAPPAGLADRTGVRIGRLTVIGYLGVRAYTKGPPSHFWLVRCDCGKYEVRNQKWCRPGRPGDGKACQVCVYRTALRDGIENPAGYFVDKPSNQPDWVAAHTKLGAAPVSTDTTPLTVAPPVIPSVDVGEP